MNTDWYLKSPKNQGHLANSITDSGHDRES